MKMFRRMRAAVLFCGLIMFGYSIPVLAGSASNPAAKAVPRTGGNFLGLEGLFTRPANAKDEELLKQSMTAVKGGAKLAALTGKLVGVRCEGEGCVLTVEAVTRWETDGRAVTSVQERSYEFRGAAGSPLYGIVKGKDMGSGAFVGTGKGVRILGKNWESKLKNSGQHVTILYLLGNGKGGWKEIGSYSRVIVHDPAAALKPEEILERIKEVHVFLTKGG